MTSGNPASRTCGRFLAVKSESPSHQRLTLYHSAGRVSTTPTNPRTGDIMLHPMPERADYIAGLRALADALEADDSLPLPYEGTQSEMGVFTSSRDEVAAYARLLGTATKQVNENTNSYGFQLYGSIRGLNLRIYADRSEVCERVVKGTREVTKTVKDPEALAAVPEIEITETVEDVEWVCHPILAPERVSA